MKSYGEIVKEWLADPNRPASFGEWLAKMQNEQNRYPYHTISGAEKWYKKNGGTDLTLRKT